MKILKRTQSSEVTTKRTIDFDIEINNIVYSRVETVELYLPRIGSEIDLPKHKIFWREYIDVNIVKELSKKDIIKLGLEIAFNSYSLQYNILEY